MYNCRVSSIIDGSSHGDRRTNANQGTFFFFAFLIESTVCMESEIMQLDKLQLKIGRNMLLRCQISFVWKLSSLFKILHFPRERERGVGLAATRKRQTNHRKVYSCGWADGYIENSTPPPTTHGPKSYSWERRTTTR